MKTTTFWLGYAIDKAIDQQLALGQSTSMLLANAGPLCSFQINFSWLNPWSQRPCEDKTQKDRC